MVSVLASNAEGRGPGQTKDIKMIFAASQVSTQHLVVRAKTGRPLVRIMCLGKVARLPVDSYFRELAH